MKNQSQKIKREEDLPPWFKLANYEAVDILRVADWALQLQVRRFLWRDVTANIKFSPSEREAIENILAGPVEPETGSDGPELCEGSVIPLTVDHVFGLTRALIGHSDQLATIWSRYIDQRVPTPNDEFNFNWSDVDKDVVYSKVADFGLGNRNVAWAFQEPYITVKFGASDKQLVRDFQDWLAESRKRLRDEHIANLVTVSHFKKWADTRLLPCLDLMIWEQLAGVKITDQLLANVLELDSAEKVRRTIRQNALNLLSEKRLSALFTQAWSEVGKTC